MTNEELAALIGAGHDERIPELWNRVSRFIDMQAGRYLDMWPAHCRWLREDMVNESYFHFLKAVEGYDPERGGFLTYLSWHVRNAFQVVLTGRSERLGNEPLNSAVSLDVPLNDADDLTLAETLIDETAEAAIRRVEDADFWQSVGRFLEDAIDRIRDRTGAEIVRCMYENGCTVKEASAALYGAVPVPYERYRKAMRQLAAYMERSAARKEMALIGLDDYVSYQGNGLGAYRNRRFTSAVEHEAVRRADEALELADIRRVLVQ